MRRNVILWLMLALSATSCTPGDVPESPFAGETVPTAPPQAPTTATTEPLIVARTSVLAVSDQVYLRSLRYDVHIPTITPDAPAPIAILLHASGPGGRATMDPLARSLASEGVVVYNIDMEVPGFGGRHPEPFTAASCALALATNQGTSHGGDVGNITLVGYSFGGLVAAVVGQVPELFRTDCEPADTVPSKVIGIAGTYDLDALEDVSTDALTAYFDGTRSSAPGVWDTADPRSYLETGTRLNMLLITASADGEVPAAIASSWANDAETQGHEISGPFSLEGTHRSILENSDLVPTLLGFLAFAGN